MKFILGKKVGMTTIYADNEGAQNVTLIECEPNIVNLKRTQEKDGYAAIQIGASKTRRKMQFKEFRLEKPEDFDEKIEKIAIDIFEVGDKVCISGITKAKGFQGVVKRHGFHGSPASHGHRHDHRAPGSIGSAFPQHVIKGKKMAGRMGGNQFTVKNLKVVYIDKEKNLLGIKGAVPGVAGRLVEIVA